MIIFINGAFGVGKTTCAEKIVQALPNSMLFDPEEIGYMLWKILRPIGLDGDFQDYAAWRPLVSSVAKVLQEAYKPILVIPMTIWKEDYFREVMNGLRQIDSECHHFCLTAPLETIHNRLRKRAEQKEGEWAFQQTEKCVRAFGSHLFEEKIDTSARYPDEIATHILKRVGFHVSI